MLGVRWGTSGDRGPLALAFRNTGARAFFGTPREFGAVHLGYSPFRWH